MARSAVSVFHPGGAGARQHCTHFKIFLDGKRRKNLTPFRNLTDAEIANTMARPAGYVDIAKEDAAAHLPVHPGDRADERRLAGAIGPDDGDDGALLNFERDIVERLGVAIKNIDAFDAQHHTVSAPR